MSELEEVRAELHAVDQEIPLPRVASAHARLGDVHAELSAAWAKSLDRRPDKAKDHLVHSQAAVDRSQQALAQAREHLGTAISGL
ncbi:hypothetical protein [Allokutzneria sp. NRRL B-24872]|uniref:hypothetical protein n=1 Tax=Allokutzneria sp. NRRL B-24872 TaxID=1137961 RepID=UPI000A38B4C5|nr:hypothetical protein [Allokutzneria sp. NRRL B-24872]